MRRLAFILASCCLLTACDAVTDALQDDAPTQAPVAEPFSDAQRWWRSFNDPLMDQLADQLLAQNIDMKIATARVAEARGLERTAKSGWFPDISATGEAFRGNNQFGMTKPASIAGGGFDASWEIDIFGRTRSQVSAAENRVDAGVASLQDVENSTVAELIKAVIEWRQAQQIVKETTALLVAQDDQVKLLQSRVHAGLVDASFAERAQAEYAQTETQLPLAAAEADTAEYQIERLMGKASGELQDVLKAQETKNLEVPPVSSAIDIPLDTIRSRPDVRAAEANMLAAQADLASARADLWPRLTIGGFFGAQGASDHIPVADNPLWALTAGVTAPLLNFGRLRGAVDSSNARALEASLAYENTVLGALQEAKTALSDYINGVNATLRQGEALQHRQDAVSLANERFTRGLTDMTDLTTAQEELDQATIALIRMKADTATAYIRLQKALGLAIKNP